MNTVCFRPVKILDSRELVWQFQNCEFPIFNSSFFLLEPCFLSWVFIHVFLDRLCHFVFIESIALWAMNNLWNTFLHDLFVLIFVDSFILIKWLYTFFWAQDNSPLVVFSLLKSFSFSTGRFLRLFCLPLVFLFLKRNHIMQRFVQIELIFYFWKVLNYVQNRLILNGGNVLKSRKQSSVWAVWVRESSSGRHHWRLSVLFLYEGDQAFRVDSPSQVPVPYFVPSLWIFDELTGLASMKAWRNRPID